ncbi:hypothetical protein EUX98_g7155 [Antrodiella citrinella]|uniref:Uncharacterized protein n=1 Tax=Antrodiella citrinella TaxID=2447956 RepID=A0A4S4MM92_9APHY|nr:hypothetical protein EUX98_g7155 [Antrodiella citrinella]
MSQRYVISSGYFLDLQPFRDFVLSLQPGLQFPITADEPYIEEFLRAYDKWRFMLPRGAVPRVEPHWIDPERESKTVLETNNNIDRIFIVVRSVKYHGQHQLDRSDERNKALFQENERDRKVLDVLFHNIKVLKGTFDREVLEFGCMKEPEEACYEAMVSAD